MKIYKIFFTVLAFSISGVVYAKVAPTTVTKAFLNWSLTEDNVIISTSENLPCFHCPPLLSDVGYNPEFHYTPGTVPGYRASPGGLITLNFTIVNTGDTTTLATDVKIFLSSEYNNTDNLPPLPFPLSVPSLLPGEEYEIGQTVDAGDLFFNPSSFWYLFSAGSIVHFLIIDLPYASAFGDSNSDDHIVSIPILFAQ